MKKQLLLLVFNLLGASLLYSDCQVYLPIKMYAYETGHPFKYI